MARRLSAERLCLFLWALSVTSWCYLYRCDWSLSASLFLHLYTSPEVLLPSSFPLSISSSFNSASDFFSASLNYFRAILSPFGGLTFIEPPHALQLNPQQRLKSTLFESTLADVTVKAKWSVFDFYVWKYYGWVCTSVLFLMPNNMFSTCLKCQKVVQNIN